MLSDATARPPSRFSTLRPLKAPPLCGVDLAGKGEAPRPCGDRARWMFRGKYQRGLLCDAHSMAAILYCGSPAGRKARATIRVIIGEGGGHG